MFSVKLLSHGTEYLSDLQQEVDSDSVKLSAISTSGTVTVG